MSEWGYFWKHHLSLLSVVILDLCASGVRFSPDTQSLQQAGINFLAFQWLVWRYIQGCNVKFKYFVYLWTQNFHHKFATTMFCIICVISRAAASDLFPLLINLCFVFLMNLLSILSIKCLKMVKKVQGHRLPLRFILLFRLCSCSKYHNVISGFIHVDSGWEEADHRSAKSVQTEGMDI